MVSAALNGKCTLIRVGHIELDSKASIRVSVGEVAHRADGSGAHDDTLALLKDVSRQGVAEAARRPGNQPGILRHPRFPLTCEMFWIFGFFADAHDLVVLRSRGVELHRRALPVTAKSSLPAAAPPAHRSIPSRAVGLRLKLCAALVPGAVSSMTRPLMRMPSALGAEALLLTGTSLGFRGRLYLAGPPHTPRTLLFGLACTWPSPSSRLCNRGSQALEAPVMRQVQRAIRDLSSCGIWCRSGLALARGVVSRAAYVSPLLGLGGAEARGLLGGGHGVAAEDEPTGRVVGANDVDNDLRGAGGVARLGPVVLLPVAVDGPHCLLVVGADGVQLHRGALPVGAECTWLDDDDLHAERRNLVCEPFGEALDPELGRLVGAHSSSASHASSYGRDLHEDPRPLCAQDGQRGPGHVHDSEEVGLDLSAEVILRHLLDRRAVRITCVVDDDIEPAEGVDGLLHRAGGSSGVGDVQRD